MAKEAYYFSHDSNARHDPKITAMRSVYGSEGYGWFWILVELMREADEYRLDMQGRYTFNAYAMQMHTECNTAERFITDCINEFELFQSDGSYFWSPSLIRRMELREQTSEKRREAANARWSKAKKNAFASNSDANAMQGKERKVNKKETKKKYADNVSLTEKEYENLCSKYGKEMTDRSIAYLSSYKEEKDYKTKSDNLTIKRWVLDAVKKDPKTNKVVPILNEPKISDEVRDHLARANEGQYRRNAASH